MNEPTAPRPAEQHAQLVPAPRAWDENDMLRCTCEAHGCVADPEAPAAIGWAWDSADQRFDWLPTYVLPDGRMVCPDDAEAWDEGWDL